eukprot:CAMPEP_0172546582 /NCGR_PEP_ID=MMETSP1067-20121228/16319_1 /TAXON_ID=265564 ORGANISM="Thalassiosira punctigera, Strain Tpunct2005C2" /NCGR_SAMPLE_ID=MMETSP1067 /ASSEMBLY_ACC=CAM_ASM_000444 /LENGTH=161 /DNA_ID=CAMNT_0013333543 /DNA_START=59 /DNA_END=547 /DNA_ORIENTATION=+
MYSTVDEGAGGLLATEMPLQLSATSNDGARRSTGSTTGRGALSDSFASQLAQQTAARQLQISGEDVDNMSYERLLQVFGDGSENRGASAGAISSLPVCKVGNPEVELPLDKRQCSICLEVFCGGEQRTSLPCLHGFHSGCVNRWLSSNGTCPVCKTPINDS